MVVGHFEVQYVTLLTQFCYVVCFTCDAVWWRMLQTLKVQLTEATTELKTVKEASVTSDVVNDNTAGPEYVLLAILLCCYQLYKKQRRTYNLKKLFK